MKYLKKFEDIIIPINVGDVLLGGRFKNKKTIVKKIGKNDKGDITINGKPLLKFRIPKKINEETIYSNMKYIKLYEDFNDNPERISIFNQDWKELIPNELIVINDGGKWNFVKKDLMINHPVLSISYYNQSEIDNVNNVDVLSDGEPDFLTFDISVVKNNDGSHSNPDKLKLNVDVSYGDQMASEFTIEAPNKVTPHHYTSVNSLHDPKTIFAFDDTSLAKLVELFNRFNDKYRLTVKDFTFLDKKQDSYIPNHEPKI